MLLPDPKIANALKRDRQAHRDRQYPPGFEKDVPLPSGKLMDAYNEETKEIIEVNNPSVIRLGEKQAENYCQECDQVFSPGHTARVEIYD